MGWSVDVQDGEIVFPPWLSRPRDRHDFWYGTPAASPYDLPFRLDCDCRVRMAGAASQPLSAAIAAVKLLVDATVGFVYAGGSLIRTALQEVRSAHIRIWS